MFTYQFILWAFNFKLLQLLDSFTKVFEVSKYKVVKLKLSLSTPLIHHSLNKKLMIKLFLNRERKLFILTLPYHLEPYTL